MPRPYIPRLSAAVWLEAQRYWEQHRRANADEIALRFGTSRAAVRHRITRERWSRGHTYRVTLIDNICAACADAVHDKAFNVRLMAPVQRDWGRIPTKNPSNPRDE